MANEEERTDTGREREREKGQLHSGEKIRGGIYCREILRGNGKGTENTPFASEGRGFALERRVAA